MRIDLESGASRRLGCHRIDAAIVDLFDHCARGAHEVMVMRSFARNVRVAPVGKIHALDQSLGDEKIEEAKDRRAPHRQPSAPRVADEVGGGEVSVASGDQARHGTARPGEADPRSIDRSQEC